MILKTLKKKIKKWNNKLIKMWQDTHTSLPEINM